MTSVTVIVTAHSREEFLSHAIESALSQTVKAHEVILVTNLSLTPPEGVKVVHCDDESLGEKAYVGLLESSGEILCFLDDDDQFEPRKIERVTEVFSSFLDLVFYHNSFTVIDSRGREAKVVRDYLKVPPYARLNPPEHGFVLVDSGRADLGKLRKLNANFNSSSICLRREVLEANAGYMRRIKAIIDSFLFYASLKVGGKLALDPERLTRYRIHPTQSSSGFAQGLEEYRASMARVLRKALEDSLVIKEMLGDARADYDVALYSALYATFTGERVKGAGLNLGAIKYALLSRMPSFVRDIYVRAEYSKRREVQR
jgi:glycosyltransferase involved in cell wall biosynthesis